MAYQPTILNGETSSVTKFDRSAVLTVFTTVRQTIAVPEPRQLRVGTFNGLDGEWSSSPSLLPGASRWFHLCRIYPAAPSRRGHQFCAHD